MKRIALFLACLCLVPVFCRADQTPRYTRLHILYTNDLWGHLFPYRSNDEDDVGGVERRATMIRQIRAESKDPVLLLDAGDIYMSGPLEDFRGEPDIAAMNAIGYDAAAVGDWDFANQPKTGSSFVPYSGARKAAFPLLCANLRRSDTGEPVLRPWVILPAGKLRVAVLGLMEGTFRWNGIETADPIQTARELVAELKDQADIIVAISHIGYTKEQELARAVPEIDVIVGGGSRHEPDRFDAPVVVTSSNEIHPFWIGGSVIVQDGRFGATLGHLVLNLRKSEQQDYRVMSCSVQLHKITSDITPAADITAILKRVSAPFDKPVGKCSREMVAHPKRNDGLEVWIAEVMRRIAQADIGAHSYDAHISLRKGTITSLDIRRMVPHQSKLTRVVMTPAQYQEAIAGKSISISGTIPAGAETIKVAADDYFATHLTAVGGVIEMVGKPVNAELLEYIKEKQTVGDEIFSDSVDGEKREATMKISFVTKPSFSVIGKLGQGPADKAPEWILPLWQEANGNFNEISGLVKYVDGKIAGVWGAMSDMTEQFKRWNNNQGKYLAGCEVNDEAIPPEGWAKWTIPSYKYVVADCSSSEYGETFNYIINEYLPKNSYTLAGAVHEYYPQPGNPDVLQLYFPIEKL